VQIDHEASHRYIKLTEVEFRFGSCKNIYVDHFSVPTEFQPFGFESGGILEFQLSIPVLCGQKQQKKTSIHNFLHFFYLNCRTDPRRNIIRWHFSIKISGIRSSAGRTFRETSALRPLYMYAANLLELYAR
jgi:hypothetical protein